MMLGVRARGFVSRLGVRWIINQVKPSYAESQRNKDFFLTILAATATKRDARAYLERYQQPYHKPDSLSIAPSSTLDHFNTADDGALLHAEPSITTRSPLHVALLGIRDPARISDSLMESIVGTLAQLLRLGLQPIVVVDEGDGGRDEAGRLVLMLERAGVAARPIEDGLFSLEDSRETSTPRRSKRRVGVYDTRTLKAPVLRQQVPVIRCRGVWNRSCRRSTVTLDSALIALCRAFGHRPESVAFQHDLGRSALVIDKLIVVDQVGGIHSPQRSAGAAKPGNAHTHAHVFINLHQEADALARELSAGGVKSEGSGEVADHHLRNLELCRTALGYLGDGASAVVTTPQTAASHHTAGGAHPLIHNLLTDKPLFSPSLPVTSCRTPPSSTTVLRKGIPVVVYRDIELASLDLRKLAALIDDSFGRQIDMAGYLNRVGKTVAAVIVAGDYEGAAIVTYEGDKVAYLDKFAVLRARQGSGGVADILFNVLVATFDKELIWRSRANNPVNKWYFERCTGQATVAGIGSDGAETGTQWRVFWRMPQGKTPSQERLQEYLEIGRRIQPTWLK
ncbi:Amino-acid acetyltransferase, mitochondrial [Savitreella phatthalungensis]